MIFGRNSTLCKIIAVEKVFKDSTLFIDGVQQENWQFEETLIDSEHSVCTAIQNSTQSPQEQPAATAIPNSFQSPQDEPIVIANCTSSENNFSLLTCESLLSAMQPITKHVGEESEAWKDFCQKFDKKPF